MSEAGGHWGLGAHGQCGGHRQPEAGEAGAGGHWGLSGHGRCGVLGRPEACVPVVYGARDGHGARGGYGRRYGHGDG